MVILNQFNWSKTFFRPIGKISISCKLNTGGGGNSVSEYMLIINIYVFLKQKARDLNAIEYTLLSCLQLLK